MGSFGLILDVSVLNVCLKVCVEFEYMDKMNKATRKVTEEGENRHMRVE